MNNKPWYEIEYIKYCIVALVGATIILAIDHCASYTNPKRIIHTYELGSYAKRVEQKRLETLERITTACTKANNCKDVAAIVKEIEQQQLHLEEKKQ